MTVTAFNLPETVSVSFLVIAGQFGNGEDRKQRLKKRQVTMWKKFKNVLMICFLFLIGMEVSTMANIQTAYEWAIEKMQRSEYRL